MNILDALILGILQGVTEFLPISSSGHLVLGEYFLGLKVESLKSFDVAVHIGTLFAILVYFWKDVWNMIKTFFGFFLGKFDSPYAKLILFIAIGTIPAILMGLFGENFIDSIFRNVKSVGICMIIVGILFVLGEFVYKRVKDRGLTWWKAIIIGCAQAIALIPGVSRSGSTIVAGLFQGIKREEAARFSFLLGIPAIAGAGVLTALKAHGDFSIAVSSMMLFVGFLTSFVFGLLSVAFLMRFLKRNTLIVFAIYLIALGIGIFVQ